MPRPSFVWDRDASRGGFIKGQRYYLDPTKQNIPLAPDDAVLRPPVPLVPTAYDTFIGLPSYRDGKRCGFTIWTAFSRATRPERLIVGVVDQTHAGDLACIDEYCRLAAETWPEDKNCRYRDRIRVDARDAAMSTGPIAARVALHHLIQDEEFCLVMDSHMQFLPHWDDALVKDWQLTQNEMAVLSVYPTGFDTIGPNLSPPVNQTRHICYFAHDSIPTIPDFGAILLDDSSQPQMGAFIGAGFQFSKCHAQTRVPLDARLKWIFLGEEFLRSMQLWTMGYDIYSPSRRGHVVFHDETRQFLNGTYKENVVNPAKQDAERELSMNRMRKQLGFPVLGEADDEEINKYYPPKVRSAQAYLKFAGVSTTDLAKDHWPCDQLHWVPYDDPRPIEALVPGYRMEHIDTHKRLVALELRVAELESRDPAVQAKLVKREGLYEVYLVVAAALVVALALAFRFLKRRRPTMYSRVVTEEEDSHSPS